MPSAVRAVSLEATLETAIRRFDGTSPVTAQVHAQARFAEAEQPARAFVELVLAVAASEGASGEALDAAFAVEILHDSTVVHADVRLGRPSPFGLAHGINAGDALCAIAFLQLLESAVDRPAERVVRMTRALHAATYALCAGQAAEIGFAAGVPATDDAYAAMLDGKSALFAVAGELGALAAGAGDERAHAYARLGRSYGFALQMRENVQRDPSRRSWTLPAAASLATADAVLADADRAAAAAGIDADGRIRAALTRAIASVR